LHKNIFGDIDIIVDDGLQPVQVIQTSFEMIYKSSGEILHPPADGAVGTGRDGVSEMGII
jgi:hypothetical protein